MKTGILDPQLDPEDYMNRRKRYVFSIATITAFCSLASIAAIVCSRPETGSQNRERRAMAAHPIFERSEDELKRSMGKITYYGSQISRGVPTVFFCTTDSTCNILAFRNLGIDGAFETNDEFKRAFTVSPTEFKRILAATRSIVERDRVRLEEVCITFTMMREDGNLYEGFLYGSGEMNDAAIYHHVFNSLDRDNKIGREIISDGYINMIPDVRRKPLE